MVASTHAIRAVDRSAPLKTRCALVTIDVECQKADSSEIQRRAVFGTLNGPSLGIPRIIDCLQRYDCKGIFFVDFSMYFFAENLLRETLKYIARQGHDLALHLHWNQVPRSLRSEPQHMIATAVRYFTECTGTAPNAYRGGAYVIDEPIAQALLANRVWMEFSHFMGRKENCTFYSDCLNNAITFYKGLLAVPVTTLPGQPQLKLDVNLRTTEEIVSGIASAAVSVIFLHSMSFLKPWRGPQRLTLVDNTALEIFEQTLSYLHSQGIQSMGLTDVSERHEELIQLTQDPAICLPAQLTQPVTHETMESKSASHGPPPVSCNFCGVDESLFEEYSGRAKARCPRCHSLERHRIFKDVYDRFLTKEFNFKNKKILSLLPAESVMRYIFQDLNVTIGDIRPLPEVNLIVDITDMKNVADAMFDVVELSSVLQHCHDDAKAIREIHRVLTPGGMLMLHVPSRRNSETKVKEQLDTTTYGREAYEKYKIADYRVYGDFGVVKRLSTCFTVKTYYGRDPITNKDDIIFVGFKI